MTGAPILVTGGGGFLGGAIVRQLLERGARVRSLSRAHYPALAKAGLEQFQGSLTDPELVRTAVQGCELVFHVAAKAGIWGSYDEFHHANVAGTQQVLDACLQQRVRRLVFTSSPSVVFNGRDMEGVDESTPYPEHYEAPYPQTKALAERLVMGANSPLLATVALRPHLIWGPGDNHLVPRIIAKGKAGQIRRIGTRENRVDSIYIDNAAEAHLLAADILQPGSPVAGKVYFLSQDQPLSVWDLINRILACAQVPPVRKSIPVRLAWLLGGLCELTHGILNLQGEPRMTRFVARELATAHWFNISAAKRDLGYHPRVTIDEGMKRLAAHLQPS